MVSEFTVSLLQLCASGMNPCGEFQGHRSLFGAQFQYWLTTEAEPIALKLVARASRLLKMLGCNRC